MFKKFAQLPKNSFQYSLPKVPWKQFFRNKIDQLVSITIFSLGNFQTKFHFPNISWVFIKSKIKEVVPKPILAEDRKYLEKNFMVNISDDNHHHHHIHKSVKTEPKRPSCCVEVTTPVKVETVESHRQAQTTTTPQTTQNHTMQSNVQAKSGMVNLSIINFFLTLLST